MPKVSVIIPVYNVERYLGECLDSILGQTLKDIEVICVDDGSTDGSGAVLDGYAANDPRVRVIHQANAGAGPARNAGLAVAQGEYVAFCDPDDFCRPDMLARLLAEAERGDCDLVVSGMRRMDAATGKALDQSLARELVALPRPFPPEAAGRTVFVACKANPVGKLLRRTFVEKNGLSFQALPHVNDLCFSFLATAKAKRISFVNEAFYVYRTGRPGSLQSELRHTGRPLCWLEAFRAVRSRLTADGEMERFAQPLLVTLLGMGVRAFFKLGVAAELEAFYAALRAEAADLVDRFPAAAAGLSPKDAGTLSLLRDETSPLPLLAAWCRDGQRRMTELRAWKREAVRRAAQPLWRRVLRRLCGKGRA